VVDLADEVPDVNQQMVQLVFLDLRNWPLVKETHHRLQMGDFYSGVIGD